MADATYDVIANLQLKGAAQAAKSTERLSKNIGSLGKGLIGVGAAYVAFRGISAVFRSVVGGAMTFEKSMEGIRIGLATVIAATNPAKDFTQSMETSGKVFKALSKDAIKSVGEAKDLFNVFQRIAGPIQAAGFNLQKVREITVGTVVAASALGVDFAQASRDIGLMIRGAAGMDTKLFNMLRSMNLITESTAEWNKSLTQAQRVARLGDILGSAAFKDASEAYAKSWAGVTSTFKDVTDQLRAAAFKPVFDALASSIFKVNEFLIENQVAFKETLGAMGTSIAETLGPIFTFAIDGMKSVVKNWSDIWARIKGVGGTLGAGGLLVGGSYAGAQAGIGAASAGGGMMGAGMLAGAVGGLFGAPVLAALGSNIMRFMQPLMDIGAMLWDFLTVLVEVGVGIFQFLFAPLDVLMSLFSILAPVLAVVIGIVTVLVKVFGFLIRGLGKVAMGIRQALTPALDWLSKGIGILVKNIRRWFGDLMDGMESRYQKKMNALDQYIGVKINMEKVHRGFSMMEEAGILQDKAPATARKKTTFDFRGSKFTIKQDFKSQSPDRIMQTMMRDFAKQAEVRLQSSFAPALAR